MRKSTLVFMALGLALAARAEFNPANFDPSVRPQDDFFQFVNGAWLQHTAIPGDQARWGAFDELRLRNQEALHTIAERAAAKGTGATPAEQMVGDFYASGMDEAAIAAAGLAPLQGRFGLIAAARTPAEILRALAALHRDGVRAGFAFFAGADAKNSSVQIANLRQGGLGLPDRDYYFTDDEKSKKLREQYVAHVARTLVLAGDAPAAAAAGAQAVMRLETALAGASLKRVQLRDPNANYHKIKVAELARFTGDLDWAGYFAAAGAPPFAELNLAHPDFFRGFAAALQTTPVADWQVYLRWHVLRNASPYLGPAFEQENFHFYSTVLTGVQEPKPRWFRVVTTIDNTVGEALGRLYVAEYFPPAAKARVLRLVEDLRAALGDRLRALEWMDAPTKEKALAKLAAFTVKMGYPDQWESYAGLTVDRGPYVANVMRFAAWGTADNLRRIGQPTDKARWNMTPPTVNASYNPSANAITFPAGILQPPFFDAQADDAVNYGGIGTVIGHEMTHGFDDSGRQFDAAGNLQDWWSPESAAQFKLRAERVVQQFSGYTVLDGLHLKGELTQGENIADLGGIKIAFAALQKARAGRPPEKIGGWTPEQRFFLSYASLWRDQMREAEQRRRVNVDPHAPGQWRVRGPLSNLDEFAAAFAVPEGAPMRRPAAERVSIW
ncbi:MAG: M13 family metallopeptidase [Opitutae bacterium]|nr:M13 family metallopeptidase [Opitutae bacterium]